MANNGNCEEMRFVIRNLVDVDDVSPATAPKITLMRLELRLYFPKEEGMTQSDEIKVIKPVGEPRNTT